MKPKKLIFPAILAMVVASATMFYGCSEDDYDFNQIVPVILEIQGPAEVAASGLTEFPITYKVPHRGGSSYNWVIGGHGGTFVQDATYPNIARVTFSQSSELTDATITVTETTMGGITSDPFSRTIILTPFCPYDMDALAGEWSGTSGSNDPILYLTTTENLNELKIKGLAGFINFSWGENWTSGDGSAIMEFSCGEVITIVRQKIGETDYPDEYFIEGTGTYDVENTTLTIQYQVFYTGGNTSLITTVLTKNTKGWQVVNEDLVVK